MAVTPANQVSPQTMGLLNPDKKIKGDRVVLDKASGDISGFRNENARFRDRFVSFFSGRIDNYNKNLRSDNVDAKDKLYDAVKERYNGDEAVAKAAFTKAGLSKYDSKAMNGEQLNFVVKFVHMTPEDRANMQSLAEIGRKNLLSCLYKSGLMQPGAKTPAAHDQNPPTAEGANAAGASKQELLQLLKGSGLT